MYVLFSGGKKKEEKRSIIHLTINWNRWVSLFVDFFFSQTKLLDLRVIQPIHHMSTLYIGKRVPRWQSPGGETVKQRNAVTTSNPVVQVWALSWAKKPPALFPVVLASQHLLRRDYQYFYLNFLPLWHLLFNWTLIFLLFFRRQPVLYCMPV